MGRLAGYFLGLVLPGGACSCCESPSPGLISAGWKNVAAEAAPERAAEQLGFSPVSRPRAQIFEGAKQDEYNPWAELVQG